MRGLFEPSGWLWSQQLINPVDIWLGSSMLSSHALYPATVDPLGGAHLSLCKAVRLQLQGSTASRPVFWLHMIMFSYSHALAFYGIAQSNCLRKF